MTATNNETTPDMPEGSGKPLQKKLLKVCPYCGSEDVSKDATVRWDVDTQQWEVTGIFDAGHCDGCDTELKCVDGKEIGS